MTSNLQPNPVLTLRVYSNPLQLKKNPVQSFEIRTLEATQFYNTDKNQRSLTQDYYEIVWIKNGTGKFRIDMQTQHIFENSVVLLSPGQHYMFEPVEKIEGYSIRFSQEFLYLAGRETSDLFHSAQYKHEAVFPVVQLDSRTFEEIEIIIFNMIKEYSNSFKSRTEALQGLLKILMIHISRKMENTIASSTINSSGELLKKFLVLLDKNFVCNKMVYQYANDLFVTPNYLNEVVKRTTGFPASHHIQQRITLEAKRLALHSEINMKEIAYKLGFKDMAHFSKFFKINCGVNFTDFRKKFLHCV